MTERSKLGTHKASISTQVVSEFQLSMSSGFWGNQRINTVNFRIKNYLLLRTMSEKLMISYRQYLEENQPFKQINPMINNLRDTVSESTFVFYFSAV